MIIKTPSSIIRIPAEVSGFVISCYTCLSLIGWQGSATIHETLLLVHKLSQPFTIYTIEQVNDITIPVQFELDESIQTLSW